MTTLIRTQTPITAPAAPLYAPYLHRDITHRWSAATVPGVDGATVMSVPDATGGGWPASLREPGASPWRLDRSEPNHPTVTVSGSLSYGTALRAAPSQPGSVPRTFIAVIKSSASAQRVVVFGSWFLTFAAGGLWSLQQGSNKTEETGSGWTGQPTYAIAVCDGASSALYTPSGTYGPGTLTATTSSSDVTIGGHTGAGTSFYDIAVIPRAITAFEATEVRTRIRAAYPMMPGGA